MKPNFALNLSHDGIGLLHRKKGSKNDWTLIGEVAIDDPEMAQKLDMLRKTAADLEKGGLATKLLIPNSQILYTEIEAPGPDDIAREVQIRKGLEGVTPYNVSELVFDWRKAGGTKVKVAVLARETLTEAESFAKDHRLNPVSFVARPSSKGFKAEVFFGKAAGAAALLGPDKQIERDNSPVPALESLRPKAPIAPSTPKETKSNQATSPKPDAPKVAPAKQEGSKPEPKVDAKPVPELPAKSVQQPKPTPAPKPEPVVPPVIHPASIDQDAEDARIAALLADVAEPSATAFEAKPTAPQSKPLLPTPSEAITKAAEPQVPVAPVLAPFPPTPAEADDEMSGRMPPPPPRRKLPEGVKLTHKRTPITDRSPALSANPASQTPESVSVAPSTVPPAAFSSRRSLPPVPPAKTSTRPPTPTPRSLAMNAALVDIQAETTAPLPPLKSSAVSISSKEIAAFAKSRARPDAKPPQAKPASASSSAITSPMLAGEDRSKPSPRSATSPSNRTKNKLLDRAGKRAQGLLDRTKSAKAGFTSRRLKSAERKTHIPAATVPPTASEATNIAPLPNDVAAKPTPKTTPKSEFKPIVGAPKTQSDDVQREVDRMTMFGARQSQKSEIGGKHKYLGLILTLVLLLVMAIVAMSSVFFFSDDTSFFNQAPEENPFAVAAIPDATLISPSTEGAPSFQSPTEHPPPTTGSDTASLQTPADQTAGDDIPLASVLPNTFEPTPLVETLATVPDVPATAPATLPLSISTGTGTSQILSEDAAQAQYDLSGVWQKAPASPAEPQGSRIDDLYVASIDPRISSQDAVALPSEVTRSQDARPASPLPPPAAGTSFALDTRGLVTPTPEGTLSPDGVLIFSGRPEFVAPARPGTPAPTLTPPDVLQELRPKPRPEGLVEDNERANLGGITRIEMAALRPTIRPASLQATADAASDGAPNELAVAASPAPGYRPENFATIVTVALERAAAADIGSDGSSVSAAPATASAGPQIPTRASVATQATLDNAIRLNEINLIGIFGSSSSRRALVRLKSGRYIKVSVGDQLNGGQVLSITETRLIYKKNNRNHTLDMLPLG